MGQIWCARKFYSPLLSSWQWWQANLIAAIADVRLWGTGKGDGDKIEIQSQSCPDWLGDRAT